MYNEGLILEYLVTGVCQVARLEGSARGIEGIGYGFAVIEVETLENLKRGSVKQPVMGPVT